MKQRTTILSACFLGLASIAAGDAGTPALHTTVEQDVIAHERAMAKAVATGDARVFAKLVASDAITVGPRGVTTTVDEEHHLPDAAASLSSISDAHVKRIDDHSVIVYYRGTEVGSSGAAWHATVWTQRDGAWVAEYQQQTPIPPDADVTSTSTSTVRAISPAELRDRIQLAKDILSELVNGSRPLSDAVDSYSSTLIKVDRWPLEQLRNTIRDLAAVTPTSPAPKAGSPAAHVERANLIAAALPMGSARSDSVTVDRTAVERLRVELDALAQLAPLT